MTVDYRESSLANSKRKSSVRELEEFLHLDEARVILHIETRPAAADYKEPLKSFVELGDLLHKLTESMVFELLVVLTVVACTVVYSMQTYPQFEKSAILTETDRGLMIVFVVEIGIRILSESVHPWRYFLGPTWQYNLLDLTVVLLAVSAGGDPEGRKAWLIFRLSRVHEQHKIR